jgi:3-dehydroquinate synthase
MHFGAFVSMQKGFINHEMYQRIENVLKNYGLPTIIPFNIDTILKKISQDKKRNGDYIDFILLEQIGRAKIVPLAMDEIKEYLNQWT